MEKAKTELLETSCWNLILIPLPTSCVTLGQSLNIWDLQSLRIPISPYRGAERGREALNVSLSCRKADHTLTITTVLLFLLYLLFYHMFHCLYDMHLDHLTCFCNSTRKHITKVEKISLQIQSYLLE